MTDNALQKKLMKMWRSGALIGRAVEIEGSISVVRCVYPDIDGGIRLADQVKGFESWNIQDVKKLLPRGR
jgi:hypothetical protein